MVGVGLHITRRFISEAFLKYDSLEECIKGTRKRILKIDYNILEFVPVLPEYKVIFINTGISIVYGCLTFTKNVKEEIFLKIIERCSTWIESIEVVYDIIPSKGPSEPSIDMPLLKSIDTRSYRTYTPHCIKNIIRVNAFRILFIRVPWQCLHFQLNFNRNCDVRGITTYLNDQKERANSFFWYSRFIFSKDIRGLICCMIIDGNENPSPVRKKIKL
jgi:hypothetical protein